MKFESRTHAGERLAAELVRRGGTYRQILAVPRGGVVVAEPISRTLVLPLRVIVVRKIGLPDNPEVAAGAVGPGREVLLNEELTSHLGIKLEDLRPQIEAATREMETRFDRYRPWSESLEPIRGQHVLLVDDGIATGFTIEAALRILRRRRPATLTLAVPVAAAATIERLSQNADAVVCLHTPREFFAVGQFYREFEQISDEHVLDILRRCSNASHKA